MALAEAGIEVKYDESGFRILKSDGDRLIFNYEYGSVAEKLFLKILFPVSVKR